MSRRLDLSSARAKWEWAHHHSYLLQSEIRGWGAFESDPPVRFRHEIKRKQEYVSFWVKSVKPLPPEWPLMLGDICNNFRAALDHIAWQLVGAGSEASKQESKVVQFPICESNRHEFLNATCKLRLPGVSLQRRLKLSPLQPYKRRVRSGAFRSRPHPLLVLPDINRQDKHRELVLLFNRPDNYRIRTSSHVPVKVIALNPGQPLQPNTEAARAWFLPPDYSGMSVEFDAPTAVCLRDWGPVDEALRGIDAYVFLALKQFGAAPRVWTGSPHAGGDWPHLEDFPGREWVRIMRAADRILREELLAARGGKRQV